MVLNFNKLTMCLGLTLVGSMQVHAGSCDINKLNELLAPASSNNKTINLNCSAQLPQGAMVTKQIIIEGQKASDINLDCNGAAIQSTSTPAILIQSVKQGEDWSVPKDITIKNCQIYGALRIHGMGRNGESATVKASSIEKGHTERVQQAAPSQITLDNLTLHAGESNMMYFAPGVNHVTLKNSRFIGQSNALALYLDAESANNVIENNTFNVQTKSREVIAVDGSAYNMIRNNQFITPKNGAIYLYRNCGEGGTIRHQSPTNNQIINNYFEVKAHLKTPLVWLGSRNGDRNYCGADYGYALGSSQSDLDYAEHNQVIENQFQLKKIKWYEFWVAWSAPKIIRVDSLNNSIANNQITYR